MAPRWLLGGSRVAPGWLGGGGGWPLGGPPGWWALCRRAMHLWWPPGGRVLPPHQPLSRMPQPLLEAAPPAPACLQPCALPACCVAMPAALRHSMRARPPLTAAQNAENRPSWRTSSPLGATGTPCYRGRPAPVTSFSPSRAASLWPGAASRQAGRPPKPTLHDDAGRCRRRGRAAAHRRARPLAPALAASPLIPSVLRPPATARTLPCAPSPFCTPHHTQRTHCHPFSAPPPALACRL